MSQAGHRPKAAKWGLLCLFLLAAPAVAAKAPAGDPVKGKQLFAKCSLCHNVDSKAPKMGPSLENIAGRKAGTLPGYAYSPAMKTAKLSWTPQNLDKFLAAPRSVVPGTKMVFPGMTAAVERANIVAYLASVSKTKAAKR